MGNDEPRREGEWHLTPGPSALLPFAGEGLKERSGAWGLGFSPRVPASNQILMIPGPLSNELLLDFGQASGRGA